MISQSDWLPIMMATGRPCSAMAERSLAPEKKRRTIGRGLEGGKTGLFLFCGRENGLFLETDCRACFRCGRTIPTAVEAEIIAMRSKGRTPGRSPDQKAAYHCDGNPKRDRLLAHSSLAPRFN